jgi:hypothetical protein
VGSIEKAMFFFSIGGSARCLVEAARPPIIWSGCKKLYYGSASEPPPAKFPPSVNAAWSFSERSPCSLHRLRTLGCLLIDLRVFRNHKAQHRLRMQRAARREQFAGGSMGCQANTRLLKAIDVLGQSSTSPYGGSAVS